MKYVSTDRLILSLIGLIIVPGQMIGQSQTWNYSGTLTGLADDVDLLLLNDGGMLIFGEENVMRTDADGQVLWQQTGPNGVFVDFAERPDGSFVGLAYENAQVSQLTLMDANGNTIRNTRQLNDISPPATEQVVVMPDGGFATFERLVFDTLLGAGRMLHRFDATGDLQWARFFDSESTSNGVMCEKDGDLFVASGFEIFRIGPTGDLVWAITVDGIVDDIERRSDHLLFAFRNAFLPPLRMGIGVLDDSGTIASVHEFPHEEVGFEVLLDDICLLDLEVMDQGMLLLAEHHFISDTIPSILFVCDTAFNQAMVHRLDGHFAPLNVSALANGTFGFAMVEEYLTTFSATKAQGIHALQGCFPSQEVVVVEGLDPQTSTIGLDLYPRTPVWTDVPLNWTMASHARTFGCTSVSVHEFEKEALRLFPNPTSDLLYIERKGKATTDVTFYTYTGQQVGGVQRFGAGERLRLEVGALANGTYIVQCLSDGRASRSLFTVQH